MKLIIILAVVALSSGAQLDRTYLPPNSAQTSGGNGQILQTPVAGFEKFKKYDFTQATTSNFGQNNGAQNNYPQNNEYDQSGNGFAQNTNAFDQDVISLSQFGNAEPSPFNEFDQRPERAQTALDRSADILHQDDENDGETYAYAYETTNGISAYENGVAVDGVKAQGGYSYTGDDGQVYSVRYTADENGFVPTGDHLPTPPPIPEEILKALEQNAQDEANGIFDDGSYSEGKYNNEQIGQQGGEAGYNYNSNGNQFNAGGDFNNGSPFEAISADNDDSIVTTNALLRSNDAAQSNFVQQNGRSTSGNQNAVEKAYLPPFQQNAQRPQSNTIARFQPKQNNSFKNQANSNLNQNGVERVYLPPQQSAQRSQSRYTPSQNNGFRNDNVGPNNQNGIEKAYLPPQQFGQNAQRSQSGHTPSQNNGFRNDNGGFNYQNGVEKTYLPPQQFGQNAQRSQSRQTSSQNNGFRNSNSGSNNQNGVEKTYLPPQQSGFNAQRPQVTANSRFTVARKNEFRNQVNDESNIKNGVERVYLPPQQLAERGQAANRNSNVQNGVERAYLPPRQFGERSQYTFRGRVVPQANRGFRNQVSNGVESSFFPPPPTSSELSQAQANMNKGFRSLGLARRNGVNREYLPPSDQKRTGVVPSAVFKY